MGGKMLKRVTKTVSRNPRHDTDIGCSSYISVKWIDHPRNRFLDTFLEAQKHYGAHLAIFPMGIRDRVSQSWLGGSRNGVLGVPKPLFIHDTC